MGWGQVFKFHFWPSEWRLTIIADRHFDPRRDSFVTPKMKFEDVTPEHAQPHVSSTEQAGIHEGFPHEHIRGVIDVENMDRRATDGRSSDQLHTGAIERRLVGHR